MRHDARTALECHEYLHKYHAPNCFDLTNVVPENEIVKEYKRQGLLHEEKVKKYLRELDLRVVTIAEDQGDLASQESTARALLDPTIDIILGARIGEHCEGILANLTGHESLGDNLRVSRPDLLIRTDAAPKWAPADVKFHSAYDDSNKSNQVIISKWSAHLPENGVEISGRIKKEDGIQLAHYHQHLANLGLASDDYLVAIVGRDFDEITWCYLHQTKMGLGKNAANFLNIYYEDFLEADQIVKKARERNQDPTIMAPTIPRLVSGKFGCDMCKFKLICRQEMEAFDNNAGHVTLLANVSPGIAEKNFPEIESIRDLAQATNLSDVGEKARRRAQVWLSKKPQLVDPTKPLEIPEFDIEVDIDLENSQAILEEILEFELMPDDRVYLYGYGIHDRTISKDWRSVEIKSIYDFSNTDEAELRVLTEMWNELERIAHEAKLENKTLGIFHYSSHEKTWWRRYSKRFAGKPSVPTLEQVEAFMARYFVDLLDYSRKVAFPLPGYSIKTLAPYSGFKWSVDGAGGANSLLKYREATERNTDDSSRTAAQEWLIAYNRDDVRATFAVREKLRLLELE